MSSDIQKATVLIVDDLPENIDVLRGILQESYKLKIALDGHKALSIARGKPKPDLILLDIMMPGIDGYEVCRQLKADYLTADIPIIFVTSRSEVDDESYGFDQGAVDYITKPVSAPIVKRRVQTHLNLYNSKRHLKALVDEQTQVIEETRFQIIQRLGRAAEYKDNETGLHVMRMSHYSRILALAAGFKGEAANSILNAAPMHDIGKIGIPDEILRKKGNLASEEWKVMRKHPEIGAAIIGESDTPLLSLAREIALSHHEKYDGTGYPHGLKGEEIPISGRIIAIADVFDALTTARPYKKAWSVEEAIQYLKEKSGTHFDPKLVNLFIKSLSEVLPIKEKFAETVD